MINIISKQEYNEIEKYLMTISPAIESMKNLPDGSKIQVKKYMLFQDVKENTGEAVEILSILTPDNKVYSAQSGTVKRSFNDIVSIKAKNKRESITAFPFFNRGILYGKEDNTIYKKQESYLTIYKEA